MRIIEESEQKMTCMTTDGTFEPFDFFVKHNFLALIDKVLILARKVLISRSNKGSINLKKAIL